MNSTRFFKCAVSGVSPQLSRISTAADWESHANSLKRNVCRPLMGLTETGRKISVVLQERTMGDDVVSSRVSPITSARATRRTC